LNAPRIKCLGKSFMFQHSCEIFRLKLLIFKKARVTVRLKNNLSFIPAANSNIMEYFYQYRSYKTDTCEYGDIS